MSDWKEKFLRREREVFKAESAWRRFILRYQFLLWPAVNTILGKLMADQEGRIAFTIENIQQAGKVGTEVRAMFNQNKQGFFSQLVNSLRRIFGLSTAFYNDIKPINQSREERVLSKVLQAYGYKDGKVTEGSLFAALSNTDTISQDIAQRINQAILSRQDLKQFQQQFFADFINPNSGFAARYYNRFTRDLFFQFDRAVALAYADELGLTHAIYAGTIKDTTRDFCEARNNKVYTRAEIANWNNQDWKGKDKRVPVEVSCGGYNCRHTYNYIDEALAEVIGKQSGGINTYRDVS
jgi:hypothetical protein